MENQVWKETKHQLGPQPSHFPNGSLVKPLQLPFHHRTPGSSSSFGCVVLRPDSKSGTLEPRPLAFAELGGSLEKRLFGFFRISVERRLCFPQKRMGCVVCAAHKWRGLGDGWPRKKNQMSMTLGHMICRFISSHLSAGVCWGTWERSGHL